MPTSWHPSPPARHGSAWTVRSAGPTRSSTSSARTTPRPTRCSGPSRERIGRWPLSVSTDRLGVTALRGAGLLRRLAAAGFPVDRAAEGRLFEVYPGGSLRLWGFDTTGYRVDAARRAVLLDALRERAPWFEVGGFAGLAIRKADAFDAVIAALATRAGALGLFPAPTPDMLAVARREGWVVLPDGPLEALIAR